MSDLPNSPAGKTNASLLIRGAIWVAIGALIAAALVCVVWVLIGDQNGLIGRAFLTIVLLAAFAGVAILETGLAANRPEWLTLTSMITWIVALIVGAIKIWLPREFGEFAMPIERLFQLAFVIGVLQLALLHVRLFLKASERYVTRFTRAITVATIGLLVALVAMLVIYLTFPHTFHYPDLYWRIVIALVILVAVGTTLIPLLNALFAPRKPRAPRAGAAPGLLPWPMMPDGVTPVPQGPDGQPDWNAYHSATAQLAAPVAPAPTPGSIEPAPVAEPPAAPPAPPAPSGAEQSEHPAPTLPLTEPGEFPPPPPAAPTQR